MQIMNHLKTYWGIRIWVRLHNLNSNIYFLKKWAYKTIKRLKKSRNLLQFIYSINTGLCIFIFISMYSYCTFMYLHRASWHSSATLTEVSPSFSSVAGHAAGGAVCSGTALQAGRSRVRFPMVSFDFFHWNNPFGRTMARGLTQPLTEMSTRDISWG